MRGGWAVGIPLTLLQWDVHRHTGVAIDPATIANSFLLGNAIYTADRLEGPVWAPERATTHASALLSCAYFAAAPATQPLVPLTLALHFGYARAKPLLAPAKPFFVAALWTLAVYYVPIWHAPPGLSPDVDALAPASLFLSIASFSHASDVTDAAEDAAAGLRTPAVLMGAREAKGFAIACALGSAFLRARAPYHAVDVYDALALSSLLGFLYDAPLAAAALSTCLFAQFVQQNDLYLMGEALRGSEWTHSLCVHAVNAAVDAAPALPAPLRQPFIDGVFAAMKAGDDAGGAFLDLYHTIARARLEP